MAVGMFLSFTAWVTNLTHCGFYCQCFLYGQNKNLRVKKWVQDSYFFAGKQVVERQCCPRAVDWSLGLMWLFWERMHLLLFIVKVQYLYFEKGDVFCFTNDRLDLSHIKQQMHIWQQCQSSCHNCRLHTSLFCSEFVIVQMEGLGMRVNHSVGRKVVPDTGRVDWWGHSDFWRVSIHKSQRLIESEPQFNLQMTANI
jgi:hypothetical protein